MALRDSQLSTLNVAGKAYDYYRIDDLDGIDHLPYSLKVLVENLVRNIDGANITDDHVRALLDWDPDAEPSHEIQFTPSRVVMQDFTGVPCVVDLATMRDAVKALGGDPQVINPQVQSDMVIDHSVQIDNYGVADAIERNMDIEYQRNRERYQFLRWGQQAFRNFRVVPPGTGIIHQVNIEYLAQVVMRQAAADSDGRELAYLDSCVGTDSHTTTVNGLGVLGWGVGGIEAEAAMLGQPISMLVPRVVGFKLTGAIPEGVHRHRRGPDHHRHAAPPRRRRPSSWNSTARASPPCRWPTAPPSATWGRNSARPAASSRSTTLRSTTCA